MGRYQTLASLKHYVLVTRDSLHIEIIDRDGEAWAGHRIVDGPKATLTLPALTLKIPRSEIYADIVA